jgi:hypothetical protein
MRAKSTKPLNIGPENSTSLADFGDSPLDVQVTSTAGPDATTVRVGPSQVQVMNIADSLTVSVSRAVQKSATVFSATTPSSSVVGLQITALSKQQAELSALKKSCNVVLAVAKGGTQSGDFGTDLQTVQNALLPEEQKKFLGDGATSSLTSDKSTMRAMVESITPRIDSELNLVSKKLTEANAASKAKGNPGQWRMRVSNEDGIVLLDSAITQRMSK